MQKCKIRRGHRYIMPHQGPREPTENTQAAPRIGAPTFALLCYKTRGSGENAKSSANFNYSSAIARKAKADSTVAIKNTPDNPSLSTKKYAKIKLFFST
jgi:hypothetical protein